MSRRVFYMSGTRADYGLMRSTLRAIADHPALELGIIVTGQHLAADMGNTVERIRRDGFPIVDTIDSCLPSDTAAAMAQSIALTMQGISQTFEHERPDLLVLLGDRGESLAAACAAAIMDVTVVHLHCGDISEGHVDNLTRFAISQYAHVLMPATEESRARLHGCGVPDDRIFVVGAPGLDDIVAGNYTAKSELLAKHELDDRRTIVVLYHPASAELADSEANISAILRAVTAFKDCQIVVLGGNLDAGGRGILQQIHRSEAEFKFWPNLDRDDYLGLLAMASVLVGNSSSGVIETPSLNLPAINIGRRQAGRQCAENVLHVPADEAQLRAAIENALNDREFRDVCRHVTSPYGDGKTAPRVAAALADLDLSPQCRIKRYSPA